MQWGKFSPKTWNLSISEPNKSHSGIPPLYRQKNAPAMKTYSPNGPAGIQSAISQ